MKIIKNEMQQLSKGALLTMVLINSMGMPVYRHIKLDSFEIVSAERYQNDRGRGDCLLLRYIDKGKRKVVGFRYPETDLVIALGHQTVKGTISDNSGEFESFQAGKLGELASQLKNIVFSQSETGII